MYRGKVQVDEGSISWSGKQREKSTFVNALVGEDILLTDSDVVTNQVFKISPSVLIEVQPLDARKESLIGG